MKTKLFFLIFILGIALVSCKKDKDETSSTPTLVGTWRCTSATDSDLSYDEFVFNTDKTGSWRLVYKDGSVSQLDITSWTTTDTKLMMEMREKGSTGTTQPLTLDYSLTKDELTLGFSNSYGGYNYFLYLKR